MKEEEALLSRARVFVELLSALVSFEVAMLPAPVDFGLGP